MAYCAGNTDNSANTLDALLKLEPLLWRGRDQYNDSASIPTGYARLDQALPAGGWGVGCLTELFPEQTGIGEFSLLLPALRSITRGESLLPDAAAQWAVLVNPPYLPYAPALANAGINLERLLVVDTDNDKDTLWATEQLLRAGIFMAVVSWIKHSTAQKQRRLQLAAEAGRTWATIYRPARASREHSPAALRMVLSATGCSNQAGMRIDIIKARGGRQQALTIRATEFDDSQGAEWPGTGNPVCKGNCASAM